VADRPLHTWLIAIFGVVFGGVGTVLFQQYMTPRPGLAVSGTVVSFELSTPSQPGFLPVSNRFWNLQVQNTGSRQATSVRLTLPGATTARFGGKDVQFATQGTTAPLDLGTIQPGETIGLKVWGYELLSSMADPLLTHSDGYGIVNIHTVQQDDSFVWSHVGSITVLFLLSGCIMMVFELSIRRLMLSRLRNKLPPSS
jgi:hypothetical protein